MGKARVVRACAAPLKIGGGLNFNANPGFPLPGKNSLSRQDVERTVCKGRFASAPPWRDARMAATGRSRRSYRRYVGEGGDNDPDETE